MHCPGAARCTRVALLKSHEQRHIADVLRDYRERLESARKDLSPELDEQGRAGASHRRPHALRRGSHARRRAGSDERPGKLRTATAAQPLQAPASPSQPAPWLAAPPSAPAAAGSDAATSPPTRRARSDDLDRDTVVRPGTLPRAHALQRRQPELPGARVRRPGRWLDRRHSRRPAPLRGR